MQFCELIRVAFPHRNDVSTQDEGTFEGSMAGLCAPLSTLRQIPHGYWRMTRVDAVRYSLIVMNLHYLLLAGLPARSGRPRSADIHRVQRHVSNVPKCDLTAPKRDFRSSPRNGHRQTGPVGPCHRLLTSRLR